MKSCLTAAEEKCSESMNLHETISLLVRTVAQKVENLDSNANSQLKTKVDYFNLF